MAILFCVSDFGREHSYGEHLCEIILNLDQWFRRCHINNFLSTALAAILFEGMELFVQVWLGHYGEHSCEIILDLDQWFRCCLKAFLRKFYFNSGGHFVWERDTVCAILLEGISRKISCKLILNLEKWFRFRLHICYFLLWWPFSSAERNNFCNFRTWHYGEYSCEII